MAEWSKAAASEVIHVRRVRGRTSFSVSLEKKIVHLVKEKIKVNFFTFCYFVSLIPLPLTLQAILDVHLFDLFCSEEGPKFSKLVQHWI